MSLERVIPLVTPEGHQYLIQFSEFKDSAVPNTVGLSIIDVVIAAENEISGINNAGTLFTISDIFFQYLEEFDVILYFYCDHRAILKSERKATMSPQQYRSHLFASMFERKAKGHHLLNKIIIIDDLQNGDHYIHLISRESNAISIEIISEELSKFNK